MKHNESKLQQECVRWFRYEFPHFKKLFFAVGNGGKRNVVTATIMKAEGVLAGVSDCILLIPRGEYHALCVEFKIGKNDLTESQEEFKQAVQKHGYKHITCREFDEFRQEMYSYIQIGKTENVTIFYQ